MSDFKIKFFFALFTGFFFLSLPEMSAQESDSLFAEKLIIEALEEEHSNKLPEALEKYEDALSIFEKNDWWERYFYTLTYKITVLKASNKLISAKELAFSSINDIETRFGKDHHLIGLMHLELAAIYHFDNDKANHKKHIFKAKELIEPSQFTNKKRFQIELYSELGIYHSDIGDYETSLEYFNKVLRSRKKIYGPKSMEVGKSYEDIGLVYSRMNEYQQVKKYAEESIKIYTALFGENYKNLTLPLSQLCNYYEHVNNKGKLLETANELIRVCKIGHLKNSREYAFAHMRAGSILFKLDEKEKAQKLFEESLASYELTYGKKHLQTGIINNELGVTYIISGDVLNASEYFHKGLMCISNEDDKDDIYFTPSIKSIQEKDLRTRALIRDKAQIMWERYNRTNDLECLHTSLETFYLLDDWMENLKMEYASGNSKMELLREGRNYYYIAVVVANLLYENTSDPKYIEDAFFFSEKIKANHLASEIQANEAIRFSNIPTDILDREKELKDAISETNLRIRNLTLENPDNNLSYLRDELFEHKETYKALMADLESQYPNYATQKYGSNIISLNGLQSSLSSETTFIEYIYEPEGLYCFKINKEKSEIFHRPLDLNLNEKIRVFTQLINNQELATEESNSLKFYKQYTQLAHELYAILLKEIITEEDKNLIIVPDQLLSYIPFEILIKEKADSSSVAYNNLSYFFKDHVVQYAYSGNLLNSKRKSSSNTKVLAYAPSFSAESSQLFAQRTGYSALKFAAQEAQEIHDLTAGDLFTGDQATEASFKLNAENYGILHLATHAFIDEEDPMYSGLLFSMNKDTSEDHVLYAYELYNMNLDANLIVLSACNTGSGKLQKGEGVMSLGRAFKYAGAKNILMSLWPVDDETTKTIMSSFYEKLKAGKGKAVALQEAKLEVIENSPRAFPYFWGAFVLMGDNTSISFTNNQWWIWGILIVLLFLVGRFLLKLF